MLIVCVVVMHLDTQITRVEIDEGSIDPVGGVIMTIRVLYQYTRGTT